MADEVFTCNAFCYEDKPIHLRLFIGEDQDSICTECFHEVIKPKFENALQFETHYRDYAKYSPSEPILKARDFMNILGRDFVRRWEEKEIEYGVEPKNRLYCRYPVPSDEAAEGVGGLAEALDATKIDASIDAEAAPKPGRECGAFVGDKDTLPQGSGVTCPKCSGVICEKCGEWYDAEHVCKPPKKEEDPFKNQERGVQYQRCPKCNIGFELLDGCNFMRCVQCETGFCLQCGQQTTHNNKKHWGTGNPTGCTLSGPRNSGIYAAPDDGVNQVVYGVLELPLFKKHFLAILKEKKYCQPGWMNDGALAGDWILVCRYWKGPARVAFAQAQVVFCVPKEGTQVTLPGIEMTSLIMQYFRTWPPRLQNLLEAYAAIENMTVVDIDEADRLRPADWEIQLNKLRLARRNSAPWYHKAKFSEILRAMENVLRTVYNTSLADFAPWTAELPASASIYFENPSIISKDDRKVFLDGKSATYYTVAIATSLPRHDVQMMTNFENLLWRKQEFFDQCVLEYHRERDPTEKKAVYQGGPTDFQFCRFRAGHLYVAMRETGSNMNLLNLAQFGRLSADMKEMYHIRHELPDWMEEIKLPSDAMVVVQHRRVGLDRDPFRGTRIAGFIIPTGATAVENDSLRAHIRLFNESSRSTQNNLRGLIIGVLEPKGRILYTNPAEHGSFVSTEQLIQEGIGRKPTDNRSNRLKFWAAVPNHDRVRKQCIDLVRQHSSRFSDFQGLRESLGAGAPHETPRIEQDIEEAVGVLEKTTQAIVDIYKQDSEFLETKWQMDRLERIPPEQWPPELLPSSDGLDGLIDSVD